MKKDEVGSDFLRPHAFYWRPTIAASVSGLQYSTTRGRRPRQAAA